MTAPALSSQQVRREIEPALMDELIGNQALPFAESRLSRKFVSKSCQFDAVGGRAPAQRRSRCRGDPHAQPWRAPPPGVARCYKMRDVLPLWFEESS